MILQFCGVFVDVDVAVVDPKVPVVLPSAEKKCFKMPAHVQHDFLNLLSINQSTALWLCHCRSRECFWNFVINIPPQPIRFL